MKKIKLQLTQKQLDAVTTCLFEWSGLVADEATSTDLLNEAKYYDTVLDSIRRQCERQINEKDIK